VIKYFLLKYVVTFTITLLPTATNYSLKHRPKDHPFELPHYSYDLSHKSFVL